jgi:hypothetical protein
MNRWIDQGQHNISCQLSYHDKFPSEIRIWTALVTQVATIYALVTQVATIYIYISTKLCSLNSFFTSWRICKKSNSLLVPLGETSDETIFVHTVSKWGWGNHHGQVY